MKSGVLIPKEGRLDTGKAKAKDTHNYRSALEPRDEVGEVVSERTSWKS